MAYSTLIPFTAISEFPLRFIIAHHGFFSPYDELQCILRRPSRFSRGRLYEPFYDGRAKHLHYSYDMVSVVLLAFYMGWYGGCLS